MLRKVYVLTVEWSAFDNSGTNVELYSTKEKAHKAFENAVKEEKENFDYAIDKDGNPVKGYFVDNEENSFEFWEDGYYAGCHSLVQLREMEVK